MVGRRLILALVCLLAGTGCHAGLSGSGTRPQQPPITRETLTVKRIVEIHNRNASAVTALSAEPRIQVSGDGIGTHRVNGMMAMERPRGFRLGLRAPVGGQVADIGSNEQEFWFWVKDNKDKAIYVCNHNEVNESKLAVSYQPDWIIEALGLREIDARESATIAAKGGDKIGQLVLTQIRPDGRGGILTKETVVEESNGHIVEHRLWAGAKKELLARATILQYSENQMAPTASNPDGEVIQLPLHFRLEWVADKLTLDITMASVKVNPTFSKEVRQAKFTEPTLPGTTRVNLAQNTAAPSNTSKIHETLPSPRSGVRLGQPEPVPMDVEGGMPARSNARTGPTGLPLLPPEPLGVIGAPIPRGSDPDAVQASTARSSWLRPSTLDR